MTISPPFTEEVKGQAGAKVTELFNSTAQVFTGQKFPGPRLVTRQINTAQSFVMEVIRSSENQGQMQLHKKHEKNVPAHLLWNVRAGASLSSGREQLLQELCPPGYRVLAWTSKH